MRDMQALNKLIEKKPQYPIEAYLFVLEALFHTRKKLKREKHVSGQELLEGIRDLALSRYGSMTKMVFEHWGIKRTIDFGKIVFNMVYEKILSKTKDDKLDDFNDVYDFDEAFIKNYHFEIKETKSTEK
jgi:uncharacterized repeat protein (TIGR04138 family)